MNDYSITDFFDRSSPYFNGALSFGSLPPAAQLTGLGGVSPATMTAGELQGNVTIEDGYLQSSNYVAATSGWQLTPTSGEINFTLSVQQIVLGTSGYIRGGQTDYNTGTGFFLGYSGAAYKFSLGNPATEYLIWDGTNLEVTASGITKLMTAGATINGATLPVPVYIKNSDTEVYACDANASGALKFFGFATSNSTDGNSIKVRISGVVGGFSGLTIGANYYVSDTVGTISTTPGTLQIPVGIAVSATEILIVNQPSGGLITGASAFTIASADTERTDVTGTYTKKKEIEVAEGGTYRVVFDIRTDNVADAAYGRVYKNGSAFGTEQSTNSATYVTKTEDLAFVPGDLIQLYIHRSGTSTALTQNFRLSLYGRNPTLVVTD